MPLPKVNVQMPWDMHNWVAAMANTVPVSKGAIVRQIIRTAMLKEKTIQRKPATRRKTA